MTTRKQYKISDLLTDSVQPFEDLDAEMLDAIGRGMVEGQALAVPVVITSDGVLVDGHQRLRVLQQQGRSVISAEDVRVIPATKEDALEWSIKLNVQRRHLTTEQKAAKALELRQTKRWSDSKIAELFGVSRAAVGQWLKGQQKLDAVIGRDGVIQTPKGKVNGREADVTMPPRDNQPWIDPWVSEGKTLRAVVKLNAHLEQMLGADPHDPHPLPSPEALGDDQFGFCIRSLKELAQTIGKVVTATKAVPSKRSAAK